TIMRSRLFNLLRRDKLHQSIIDEGNMPEQLAPPPLSALDKYALTEAFEQAQGFIAKNDNALPLHTSSVFNAIVSDPEEKHSTHAGKIGITENNYNKAVFKLRNKMAANGLFYPD